MPAFETFPLLIAADLWQVVFGVIVFILYSIGQLISAREQAKKEPVKPRRPRRPEGKPVEGQGLERQRPVGDPPAGAPANQEDALRREVEDFLRRAQGKPPRQEQPARTPQKPRPKKQPLQPEVELVETPEPTSLPSESLQPTISMRKEGVAEHVATHISSKKIVEHAESLGDKVALADERLESRLHEKFDHQLGRLGQDSKPKESKPKETSAADEIVDLLQTPGGMRQLVIAQEILRRPEW